MDKNNAIVLEENNGTSAPKFHVTGIGEYWFTEEISREKEETFTKSDFERDLRKASRKVKK